MKLNQETRAVLRKELKWLPDLLPEGVGEFKFQVFDLDALSMRKRHISHEAFQIHLLDVNGVEIGQVGKQRLHHRFSWITRKLLTPLLGPMKGDGFHYNIDLDENLEDAIERLKPESWNTQFVLDIDGYHATLHKMPRGRSLSVQMEAKRQEAQMHLARFLQDN